MWQHSAQEPLEIKKKQISIVNLISHNPETTDSIANRNVEGYFERSKVTHNSLHNMKLTLPWWGAYPEVSPLWVNKESSTECRCYNSQVNRSHLLLCQDLSQYRLDKIRKASSS